jgi:hypothetical protein
MFIIVLFHPYPQKLVRIWITNTFIYKCSCVHDCASSLLCNLGSLTLISIALGCAFVNVYTSMDGCTFSMTFSSLASVYSNCASTNCCSTISSSSNFSMNTRSSKIALGHACSLAHQLFMMLHKNSIADLLVLYISWIIVCTNCIFSLYILPLSHYKDDDECDDDLTTNIWIFNTPSHFTFCNSFSTSFFLNIFSSSYFCWGSLCFFFLNYFLHFLNCIIYNFSIILSTPMGLWKMLTTFDNKQK